MKTELEIIKHRLSEVARTGKYDTILFHPGTAQLFLSLLTKQDEDSVTNLYQKCDKQEEQPKTKLWDKEKFIQRQKEIKDNREQPQADDVEQFYRSKGYCTGTLLSWDISQMLTKAYHEAKAQSLKQANAEWISVNDELPKNGDEVLLFREDAGVFQGFYGSIAENFSDYEVEEMYRLGLSEDEAFNLSFWLLSLNGPHRLELDENPTHWMPLPKFPK